MLRGTEVFEEATIGGISARTLLAGSELDNFRASGVKLVFGMGYYFKKSDIRNSNRVSSANYISAVLGRSNMNFRNDALKPSVLLLLTAVLTIATSSCSNPEKDFEKAQMENTIGALENFINKHPESNRIDEAKNMILEIAYNDALGENTNKAFDVFINTYNPDDEYISRIDEQIKLKQEYLQQAIKAHNLAQQETDDGKKKQSFDKAEDLFNKANFEEVILDISSVPLLNLHLGENSELSKIIDRPFQTTKYVYGSSTVEYEYSVKGEQLNTYTLYNLVLASTGKTDFIIKLVQSRDQNEHEIWDNRFSISSNKFTGFSGLIKNNDLVLQEGDKIVLRISATGDNYGTSADNFSSYIKMLKPEGTIADSVLSARAGALSWFVSNVTHNSPSSLVLAFIAQLDDCLLENKNGEWLLGWGNMNKPYRVRWFNNIFTDEELGMEIAQNLGMKKFGYSYSAGPE